MNFSKTVCRILICLALSVASSIAEAQSKFNETRDIKYVERSDAYSNERCKLDVKSPANAKALPVIVWFHGGGITAGNKHYPFGMENENGLVLVAVNYRLSPKIKAAEAVEDAADAVAWTFANIEKFGGDKNKIFVSGHSAGAYLGGMVAFAPKYLQKRGLKNTDIAGAILLSGQATTHFQVRKDFGDKDSPRLPKIDEYSLLGNAANKLPPVSLILGDRRLEFPERVEENFLLECAVRKLGSSPFIEIFELQGLDHGTVSRGFSPIAKNFVKNVLERRERK